VIALAHEPATRDQPLTQPVATRRQRRRLVEPGDRTSEHQEPVGPLLTLTLATPRPSRKNRTASVLVGAAASGVSNASTPSTGKIARISPRNPVATP
jgi:hypothetical protein